MQFLDGCTYLSGGYIVAGRTSDRPHPWVVADLFISDICAGTNHEYVGTAAADSFTARDLSTGHVVVTIELRDAAWDTLTLPIDLTFTGTGAVTRNAGMGYKEVLPHNLVLLEPFQGANRQATVTATTPSWSFIGEMSRGTGLHLNAVDLS